MGGAADMAIGIGAGAGAMATGVSHLRVAVLMPSNSCVIDHVGIISLMNFNLDYSWSPLPSHRNSLIFSQLQSV